MAEPKRIQAQTEISDADRLRARIAELEAQVEAQKTKALTTAGSENVAVTLNGTRLTMVIDLAHRGQKSDKSTRVATTFGNRDVKLPDGTTVKVGLNAYIPDKGGK